MLGVLVVNVTDGASWPEVPSNPVMGIKVCGPEKK